MTNTLLIMADELSTWGLGCYAGRRWPDDTAITRNTDALAARGVRFTSVGKLQYRNRQDPTEEQITPRLGKLSGHACD